MILTHDVHHLLTGYSTDLKGETEISTWELSTNCTNNYAAFILNTYAMALGLLINLPGVWKAWLRGRYTCNLYRKKYSREELVNKNLEELKKELKLFHEPKKYKGSFGPSPGFGTKAIADGNSKPSVSTEIENPSLIAQSFFQPSLV